MADVFLEEGATLGTREAAQGPYVLLEVSDTGTGMDEETQRRAFEPFFTTKADGEGTGLGLATVYGIVQQLGGHIAIDSERGRGTTIRIWAPRAARSVEPAQAAIEARAESGAERILLVEDDRLVRAGIRHQLSALGYEVLAAAGPEEALTVCGRTEEPIALLLTDIVMPGMSGYDLSREVLRRKPGTKALYMSAFPNEVLIEQGRLAPGLPSIEKPFSDEELAHAVRRAIDGNETVDPARKS